MIKFKLFKNKYLTISIRKNNNIENILQRCYVVGQMTQLTVDWKRLTNFLNQLTSLSAVLMLNSTYASFIWSIHVTEGIIQGNEKSLHLNTIPPNDFLRIKVGTK